MNKIQMSKFLSYVLRHKPDSIGIVLDKAGWIDIDELIEKSIADGKALDRLLLYDIVAEDNKQRYAISEDGKRIRANQGHSVEVDLELKAAIPPVKLFHGTYVEAVDTILKQGLKKMKRHHVHLSADPETAGKVGSRRGKAVVLEINTKDMVKRGIKFFITANGVWLTDFVDPEFISVPTT
jgi:putative RNA 2'-phosphotransferase